MSTNEWKSSKGNPRYGERDADDSVVDILPSESVINPRMRVSAFRRLLRFAWLKSQTPSKLPGERVVKRKRLACLQPRFRVNWLQKPCQVLRVFCREDFFVCFAFALISPLDYNFLENSRGHCHSAVACRHWHLYFSSPGKGTFLKKRQLRMDAFSPMPFLSLCCLIIPSFY